MEEIDFLLNTHLTEYAWEVFYIFKRLDKSV